MTSPNYIPFIHTPPIHVHSTLGALSREQLYAPLTDYLPGGAPPGGAPAASASAASASALRIHPSVRESARAEHLAAVSAAYVFDPRFFPVLTCIDDR